MKYVTVSIGVCWLQACDGKSKSDGSATSMFSALAQHGTTAARLIFVVVVVVLLSKSIFHAVQSAWRSVGGVLSAADSRRRGGVDPLAGGDHAGVRRRAGRLGGGVVVGGVQAFVAVRVIFYSVAVSCRRRYRD